MASTVAPTAYRALNQASVVVGQFAVAIAQGRQPRINSLNRRQNRLVQGVVELVAEQPLPSPLTLTITENLDLGDSQRPGAKAGVGPGPILAELLPQRSADLLKDVLGVGVGRHQDVDVGVDAVGPEREQPDELVGIPVESHSSIPRSGAYRAATLCRLSFSRITTLAAKDLRFSEKNRQHEGESKQSACGLGHPPRVCDGVRQAISRFSPCWTNHRNAR